jgi:hypothetical protein
VDACQKVSRQLVVARGDGTKVLEFIEEALDEIALAIEREIAGRWRLTVGFGRDHRGDVSLGKIVAERIGVVGFVGDQSLRIDLCEQRLRASQIVSLTRREHHIDGIAERIDEDVNFAGQSAAGSADRLLAVFFRAPALCW